MYTVKTTSGVVLIQVPTLKDAVGYAENQTETVQITSNDGSVLYEWTSGVGLRDFLIE